MKTFIVHQSDYMGDEPEMFSVQAKNLHKCLDQIFEEEVSIKDARECNGDGQPYLTIFDVSANRKVFG